jgi:S-formylglutathione hydrolase FrmB
MKKLFTTLPLSIFCLFTAFGQITQMARGTVLEGMTVKSAILKKDMSYNIYLPADYFSAQRKYPVVYLLHGMWGGNNDWVQSGEANRTADKAMANGDIPDMIIVMPDCGNQWYINSAEGYNYEDYFMKELIPHIDSNYQTRTNRESRGISGLSMGGYGSILYCLKHPDIFSTCAALSSGIFTDEETEKSPDANYDRWFAPIYGKAKGKDRLQLDTWKKNSTLGLMAAGKEDDLKKVKWYFDCGDDDFLFKGNAAMHVLMSERKIPHEFRMRDGAHTWEYWRTGLGDALKFIGQSFKH